MMENHKTDSPNTNDEMQAEAVHLTMSAILLLTDSNVLKDSAVGRLYDGLLNVMEIYQTEIAKAKEHAHGSGQGSFSHAPDIIRQCLPETD